MSSLDEIDLAQNQNADHQRDFTGEGRVFSLRSKIEIKQSRAAQSKQNSSTNNVLKVCRQTELNLNGKLSLNGNCELSLRGATNSHDIQ